MRTILFIAFISVIGCSDYLNIVPDNTITIEKMFQNKSRTLQALATCYSFLPNDFRDHYHTQLTLGNEMAVPIKWNQRTDVFISNRVMMGDQNQESPYFSFWDGGGYATNLYEGIRYCNIFLNNIKEVPDITSSEKKDYIAQVKFLKAYFHFLLIKNYGPIVISDIELHANMELEELANNRTPVDSCFNYVINLIDDAYDDLPFVRNTNDYGQITKIIAKAIKGKILLFSASPLFNGNSEYYRNFIDPQTQKPYFNLNYEDDKWLNASNELKEAIELAHDNGYQLFETKEYYDYDLEIVEESKIMKYAYNNRYSIVEPWNKELLWGYSNINPSDAGSIQSACQVFDINAPNNYNYSYNYLSASQNITEKFYTRNGVSMDEDKTYDYENKDSIISMPNDNYHLGYLSTNHNDKIILQHTNREPRFYAWLAVDRSIWRTHAGTKYDIKMRYNESPGGGNDALSGEYYPSGIAIKKWVHPESGNLAWQRVTIFPLPLVRLADLYLMYAEAMNEYYGPNEDSYYYLNKIRNRAGLPKIEEIWSNASIVKTPGKHLTQEGLREIIRHERAIELSFEGHQYDDQRRWKTAENEYSTPLLGWDSSKEEISDFHKLRILQNRKWNTPRDYLTPLSNNTLNQNRNLIQNPGW